MTNPKTPWRRVDRPEECHEAREGGEEMEAEEEEERHKEEGDRDGDTPLGPPVKFIYVGGGMLPPRGKRRPSRIRPISAHLLLQRIYGDFLHHNNGSHLEG